MDLSKLKWTKNINRGDGEWAYSPEEIIPKSKIFNLHWKKESLTNAKKLPEKDLIILRQKTRVTHIVELLDDSIDDFDEHHGEWNYRRVKAVWMAEPWSEPPHQDDIFGYKINYPSGNAINLESSPKFNQYWDTKGGLYAFHKHITGILKL